MGQHSGSIHIRVKDPKDWLKLKNAPQGLLDGAIAFFYGTGYSSIEEISSSNKIDIVLSGEGEVRFGDLNMGRRIDTSFDSSQVCDMCSVVKALADALGQDAIIIAAATYNGSDAVTSCAYYLGEKLKYEYFWSGKKARLYETVDTGDIMDWLKAGGFKLTALETTYLQQFSLANNLSTKLTKLKIPAGTMKIENSAFSGCLEITDIVFPNSVKEIGNLAFYGCVGLASIIIPSSVTNIGKSAFNGCRGLEKVTVSENVTSIGDMAFYSCVKLKSIIFMGTMEKWNSVALGRAWSGLTLLNEIVCSDGIIPIKLRMYK